MPLSFDEDNVPLVEFMYLVFTCIPGESYCRQLRSSFFVLVLCISNANYLQRDCPSVCYEHGFSVKSGTLQIDSHFSLHLWIMLQPVQYTMVCCGQLTEVVFSVC